MNYQKKEMFDSDSEWGFFIDLETYSLNLSKKTNTSQEYKKKFIPDQTLFTISENEKKIHNYHNYYENETNNTYDDDNELIDFSYETKTDIVKEKIQFYATLGIVISGLTLTSLLAYSKLI